MSTPKLVVFLCTALLFGAAQATTRKLVPTKSAAAQQACTAKCAAYIQRFNEDASEVDEEMNAAESATALRGCTTACLKGWNPPAD